MLLYIRTLTGKSFSVNVDENDPIEIVKFKIQEREGIPPD